MVGLAGDKARAFFLSSGSEATEAAIRLALLYWKAVARPSKRRILSRLVSYHGNTAGALSLSSDMRRQELVGLTIAEPTIPPCYCYRCPWGLNPDSGHLDCASALEEAVLRAGPENVAAFVVEPIIGATGGAIVPHRGYFKRIREICDTYEVLLIVDEVITGGGRTGKWFAMHHWDVPTDMMILGKGINAGFTPLSAVLLAPRVVDAIENSSAQVTVGHTHSGNPASAAIANAVLDYIEEHDLLDRAEVLGSRLAGALHALADRHPTIGNVRGLGLLAGLEFVEDRQSARPFCSSARFTDLIVEQAFANGLILYPCRGLVNAADGSAVLVAPPLTISDEDLETLIARLDTTLTQLGTPGIP